MIFTFTTHINPERATGVMELLNNAVSLGFINRYSADIKKEVATVSWTASVSDEDLKCMIYGCKNVPEDDND